MSAIASLLQTLPSPSDGRSASSIQSDTPNVVGSLRMVCDRLHDILNLDYADCAEDVREQTYSFDYVITADECEPSMMHVLTRLSREGDPGNIFYGRKVVRLGTDSFMLIWDP